MRFLKKKQKEKKGEMEDEEASVFLEEFQKKLSANTISGGEIKKLESKFKLQITEYLNSPQAYKDFLTVNKSKNNKFFYVLHLKELGIISDRGHLPCYSFYANKEFEKGIKQIIKNFYIYFFNDNEKKEEEKEIDTFLDDELEKYCQEAEEEKEKAEIVEYDFDDEEDDSDNNFGML